MRLDLSYRANGGVNDIRMYVAVKKCRVLQSSLYTFKRIS